MNNNILTLEQMQKMSIDEMIDAYKSGYTLSGTTETLPIYSGTSQISNTNTYQTYPMTMENTTKIYPMTNTGSHYTSSDVVVIAAAIGISVGLLAMIVKYMIRKEEERIVKEIKQTVASVTQKAGIIERLIPIAERIGERILSPKPQS